MRPATRWRDRVACDDGTAVVEFVVLAVLVLVPLLYVVMCVARVQAAAYAATQAVREAGRVYVTAESVAQAAQRAGTAARLAVSDQGFELPAGALSVTCAGGACLSPGSQVRVRVSLDVPLPLLPDALADAVPSTIPVVATHLAAVDSYRADP